MVVEVSIVSVTAWLSLSYSRNIIPSNKRKIIEKVAINPILERFLGLLFIWSFGDNFFAAFKEPFLELR